MDPVSQTLLTLGCMFAAFLWGKVNGFNRGAIWAFDRVLDEIEADAYSIDEDNEKLSFFKRGRKFSAKRGWSNDEDD